jgi:hypothetical protein
MGENTPTPGQGLVPEALPLNCIDTGVYVNELTNLEMLPDTTQLDTSADKTAYLKNPESLTWRFTSGVPAPDTSQEVTYRGTQLALLKTYDIVEHR